MTTINVVRRSTFSLNNSSSISDAVMRSSPLLGSSTSRILGSSTSARASPARFRIPPEFRRHFLPVIAEADVAKDPVDDDVDLRG